MKTIFWHRRDLRINDNAGLFKALKSFENVSPVFIFDSEILKHLHKNDQRVLYIHKEIAQLKKEYQQLGSDLLVFFGNPLEIIPKIATELEISSVYINRDYEPNAILRDKAIADKLKIQNVALIGSKDQVIFEKNEVLKNDGNPYTIFTPYSRKWKEKLTDFYLKSYPIEKYIQHLSKVKPTEMISLKEMNFENETLVVFPNKIPLEENVKKYHLQRDFPALDATTKLSVHLRFGTISIRELARKALEENETYLNELIWRDFYQMILFHFPNSVNYAFKKQYDNIVWEFNEVLFEAWKKGETGYPLVDAGMRELNETGHMHNRVRMVVASFLTKHLLHDWRLGERYFAEKLLDFELASNVGGWQWAAGTGCDAAPYFRVFNPTAQQLKFDKNFEYIKKWVPEFGTDKYIQPIVEHVFARERCLKRYKEGLGN